MPDEISRLSAELARDPAGAAWVSLADALRRAGQADAAERVALRGLERHPYSADGHDVLARIRVWQGDLTGAGDEWDMALRLDARHLTSLKGLGFLAYRRGDLALAERHLREACAVAPDDKSVREAHRRMADALGRSEASARGRATPFARADVMEPATAVRDRDGAAHGGEPNSPVVAQQGAAASHPASRARDLFADIGSMGVTTALLVDHDGLVLAGRDSEGTGNNDADALAAELSGLGDEATRALLQLGLGAWETVVVECEGATLAFAPVSEEAVVLVATPTSIPLGLVRILLERTQRRAGGWLEAL